jgi:hypothetical protein
MRGLLSQLQGRADFLILHQYFSWPFDSHKDYVDPSDPVSVTGWTLSLTYSAATATTTTLSANAANPAFYANNASSISIQYTATVSPSGATGTVTFTANGSTISGCSGLALSGGVAHCTTSLSQGNNVIVAQYTPTSRFKVVGRVSR